MIISDLQHIELATENEVQVSGGRRWRPPCPPGCAVAGVDPIELLGIDIVEDYDTSTVTLEDI